MNCKILFVILLAIGACKRGNDFTYRVGNVEVDIPSSWRSIDGKLIDGGGGRFISGSGDTIFIDLSYYANNLSERNVRLVPVSSSNQIDTDAVYRERLVFVEDSLLRKGVDIDKYRLQNVVYKRINNIDAKVITPRIESAGVTGLYCDSVGNDPLMGNVKLSIYGQDLTRETHESLLKSFETVRFTNSK